MGQKDDLGRRGEDWAAAFLEDEGYRIIDRNWRCRHGEVDIIARDGANTVFVEVKTRSALGFGHPFESITPIKLGRLRRLAALWCEEFGASASRIRIDVVGVIAPREGRPRLEHLRGIS